MAEGGVVTQSLEALKAAACAGTYRWSVKGLMDAIDHHALPGSIYSDAVDIGGVPWRFLLYPNGNGVRSLSLYVDLAISHALPAGWSRAASFAFTLVNQKDPLRSITKAAEKMFFLGLQDWGFRQFLPLAELYSDEAGFLVDDVLAVEVTMAVTPRQDAADPPGTGTTTPRASGSVGLSNQGATCYLNSLIQTLFHVNFLRVKVYAAPIGDAYDPVASDDEDEELPTLHKVFRRPPPPPPPDVGAEPNLVGALQHVFYNLQFQKKPVSTKELTAAFGWGGEDVLRQHDIHELIRVLCAALDDRFQGTKAAGILDLLFQGTLQHSIVCSDVDFQRTTDEHVCDLQLNVRGYPTVNAALDAYFAPEVLEGSNSYMAGDAGLQRATRYSAFTKTPPVLMLQLKRFDFDMALRKQTKVNDKQAFPTKLDLSPYLSNEAVAASPLGRDKLAKYVLVSILVHSGDVNAGHYYSFIRPGGAGAWYRFDDERVFRVSDEDAVDENFGGEYGGGHLPRFSSAYVLTYLRAADVHWLLPAVTFQTVPERVHRRFGRITHESTVRDVADAHLYVAFKIITNAAIAGAESLQDLAVVPVKFLRKDPFATLLRAARGIIDDGSAATPPASPARTPRSGHGVIAWRMERRLNGTLRPSTQVVAPLEASLEQAFDLGSHLKDAVVVYVHDATGVEDVFAEDAVKQRLALAAAPPQGSMRSQLSGIGVAAATAQDIRLDVIDSPALDVALADGERVVTPEPLPHEDALLNTTTASSLLGTPSLARNSRQGSRNDLKDVHPDGSVNVFSATSGCQLLFLRVYDAALETCVFTGCGYAVHSNMTLAQFVRDALGLQLDPDAAAGLALHEDVRDGVLEALDPQLTLEAADLAHGDVLVVDVGSVDSRAGEHPFAAGRVTPPQLGLGVRECVRGGALTAPVRFTAMGQPDCGVSLEVASTATVAQAKLLLAEELQLPMTTAVEIHQIGTDHLPLPMPLPGDVDLATALAFGWNTPRKELHYALHRATPNSAALSLPGASAPATDLTPRSTSTRHTHISNASSGVPATATVPVTLVSRIHGEIQEVLKLPFPECGSVALLKWHLLEDHMMLGPDGTIGAAAVSDGAAPTVRKQSSAGGVTRRASTRPAGCDMPVDRPRGWKLCSNGGGALAGVAHAHPFEKRVLVFEVSLAECSATQVYWDGHEGLRGVSGMGFALCAEVVRGEVDLDPMTVSFRYAPGLSSLPSYARSYNALATAPPVATAAAEHYLVQIRHAELDNDVDPDNLLDQPPSPALKTAPAPRLSVVSPHSLPWLVLVKAKDTVRDLRARLLKERPLLSALEKFLKDPVAAKFHVSPSPFCADAEPLPDGAPVLRALAAHHAPPRTPSLCLIRPTSEKLKASEEKSGPGISIRKR